MFQLFYVSDAVGETGRQVLQHILSRARENNQRLGITGMLLFRHGHYAQAIEGKEMTVRCLFANIAADTRHDKVTTVFTGAVTAREFPEWSMAYRDTSQDNSEVVGFSDFLNRAAEQKLEAAKGFPPTSLHLLQTFRRAFDSCPDDL